MSAHQQSAVIASLLMTTTYLTLDMVPQNYKKGTQEYTNITLCSYYICKIVIVTI